MRCRDRRDELGSVPVLVALPYLHCSSSPGVKRDRGPHETNVIFSPRSRAAMSLASPGRILSTGCPPASTGRSTTPSSGRHLTPDTSSHCVAAPRKSPRSRIVPGHPCASRDVVLLREAGDITGRGDHRGQAVRDVRRVKGARPPSGQRDVRRGTLHQAERECSRRSQVYHRNLRTVSCSALPCLPGDSGPGHAAVVFGSCSPHARHLSQLAGRRRPDVSGAVTARK